MERDERLLPLPNINDLQLSQQDTSPGYSPFYDDDNFKEARSIREYFLVVYKRLPLILALTIIATAVTAFYMYKLPSIYESTTTMVIEPRRPKVTAKDAININFGGDVNYYNTQLKLLQNPDLMREVVIRLNLQRDPNLFSQQNKSVLASLRSMISGDKSAQNKESSLPTLTEPSTETTETPTSTTKNKIVLTPEEEQRAAAYAGNLLGGLWVEQIPSTNLVNIRLQSSNAELAPKVTDMVATVFIEKDVRQQTQGSEQAYEDLSKTIETLKSNITQQESARLEEMKQSGLPLVEKGQELASQVLTQMSTEWISAEAKRRELQAEYEAAQQASQKGEIISVMGDNKRIQDALAQGLKRRGELEQRIEKMDTQIQDSEAELAGLQVKYQDEYPKVKELKKKIDTLKKSRDDTKLEVESKIENDSAQLKSSAAKEVLTGLQAQLQSATKRENEAKARYVAEISKANGQGQAATRLITLTREIETNRQLLDTYTQRQKEQELTISSSRPDNLSISSNAVRPTVPIAPNRNRNVIIAFLVSLAAGVGLAFLFDYLDDSIKSSDDVGRHLGLPTLALIPHHNSVRKQKKAAPSTAIAAKNGAYTSMALISLEDTRSAMAEAYRHLRTSLLFSSAGKPPQTILVTSSQPSEGKTTTAINTAVTLAQSGADIVIIDCDLRRPRLHSHFNLDNNSGLTNYLSGDRNPDNLLKPFPGLPNLKVVTSGPIPPNPAELLSSNEMKNLLQFLKGNFKHVVIDSPPAISFTDAAILSTLVDGVVLVAMAGKSSIHLMRRFKQRLSTIGARIYGVVLNGIKPNTLEYGYYGYGYTYSYYDAPEDDETPRMEEEAAQQAAKN